MRIDTRWNSVFFGNYRIEWSDQKIVATCSCKAAPELEIFSDCPTICPECGRKYTISEFIKVEVPKGIPLNDDDDGDIMDLLEKENV